MAEQVALTPHSSSVTCSNLTSGCLGGVLHDLLVCGGVYTNSILIMYTTNSSSYIQLQWHVLGDSQKHANILTGYSNAALGVSE